MFHVPPMNTIQNTFFRSNSSSNAIFDRELTCKVRKYSKFVNKPHRTTFLIQTRGHARFAHSPLVIRLGDSRIRRGNSGYGEVLRLGWHNNYRLTGHYSTIFSLKINFPAILRKMKNSINSRHIFGFTFKSTQKLVDYFCLFLRNLFCLDFTDGTSVNS